MEQNEHSKYEDPKKRAEIGKMSGLIGIACNFLLAGSKIAVGNFAGSTSIVADGLNNMSDAASSAVTLIGFKLAEKLQTGSIRMAMPDLSIWPVWLFLQ